MSVADPVFSVALADQSVSCGTAVAFHANATSIYAPITYQWYKNGVALSGETGASLSIVANAEDDGATYYVEATNSHASTATSRVATLSVSGDDEMNCDCEAESPYRTLSELRVELLRRLGFSAMVNNPPPGVNELLTSFLQEAQRFVFAKRPELRAKRFFKWTMVPGVRYYGLDQNETCCGVTIDPRKVDWCGIRDLNGRWYHLYGRIPPEFYTTVTMPALPFRIEIRSCIEVFPAPNAAYTLFIKGDFGLTAFTNPEHKCSVDDDLVFRFALANAKAHYRHPDAGAVRQDAISMLMSAVAGKHNINRYVPGTVPRPIPPIPTMIEFNP